MTCCSSESTAELGNKRTEVTMKVVIMVVGGWRGCSVSVDYDDRAIFSISQPSLGLTEDCSHKEETTTE